MELFCSPHLLGRFIDALRICLPAIGYDNSDSPEAMISVQITIPPSCSMISQYYSMKSSK
jgi:hypothetical protein